jgi:hypothetical protein
MAPQRKVSKSWPPEGTCLRRKTRPPTALENWGLRQGSIVWVTADGIMLWPDGKIRPCLRPDGNWAYRPSYWEIVKGSDDVDA